MANPIKSLINNNTGVNTNGVNNSLIEQFNQFKRTFSGDPQSVVNKLLSSGRFNQAQIEQAKAIAQQLRGMIR